MIQYMDFRKDIYYSVPVLIACAGLVIYLILHRESRRTVWCTIGLMCTCLLLMASSAVESHVASWGDALREESAAYGYGTFAEYISLCNISFRLYLPLRYLTAAIGYSLRPVPILLFWLMMTRKSKMRQWLCSIPAMVSAVLYGTSFITHWCFHFDTVMYYFHADYALHYLVYAIGIFHGVLLLREIAEFPKGQRKRQVTFTLFLLISYLLASILEATMTSTLLSVNSIGILNSVVVACTVLYFLFMKTDSLEHSLDEKERILREKESILRLSQIRPHFIFNTLNCIMDMCPQGGEAQAALLRFSKYLRSNIDFLSENPVVPFSRELEHCKNYLAIEKMRFDTHLTVIYDIRAVDFSLPYLSLQPLVENAVKYGLAHRGDVQVTISAEELPDGYRVTVADNGGGFEPSELPQPETPHVGIENVRYRLVNLCRGTLTVNSVPGEGTTALLFIPKEDAHENSAL